MILGLHLPLALSQKSLGPSIVALKKLWGNAALNFAAMVHQGESNDVIKMLRVLQDACQKFDFDVFAHELVRVTWWLPRVVLMNPADIGAEEWLSWERPLLGLFKWVRGWDSACGLGIEGFDWVAMVFEHLTPGWVVGDFPLRTIFIDLMVMDSSRLLGLERCRNGLLCGERIGLMVNRSEEWLHRWLRLRLSYTIRIAAQIASKRVLLDLFAESDFLKMVFFAALSLLGPHHFIFRSDTWSVVSLEYKLRFLWRNFWPRLMLSTAEDHPRLGLEQWLWFEVLTETKLWPLR